MEKGLSGLAGAGAVALLVCSALAAAPAYAQLSPPQPIWATVNADAQGNYPGGNQEFDVFVVNSAQTATENFTINNMTLTAPFANNFGPGLPATLAPGQSIALTIFLPIPTNFTQKSFTANLVVNGDIWNGTAFNSVKVTGSATSDVLSISSNPTTPPSSQPAAQTGAVATSVLEAGVAIPSLVAIILLVLLVRARGGSKRTGP